MDNGNISPPSPVEPGDVKQAKERLPLFDKAEYARAVIRAAVYATAFAGTALGLATWTCDASDHSGQPATCRVCFSVAPFARQEN